MNKQDFLQALKKALADYPPEDVRRTLEYYEEMIDDRVEDGLSEAQAVAAVGTVEDIVNAVCDELPLSAIVKSRVQSHRRLRAWEIVLLAVGSPIWVSLLMAAFCVALALYVCLWAVVICLFAVAVSLYASVLGCAVTAVVYGLQGNSYGIAASVGAAMVCVGVGGLFWALARLTAKGVVALTRVTVRGVKRRMLRKDGDRA